MAQIIFHRGRTIILREWIIIQRKREGRSNESQSLKVFFPHHHISITRYRKSSWQGPRFWGSLEKFQFLFCLSLGAVHKLHHTIRGAGASRICDKCDRGAHDLKNGDVTKVKLKRRYHFKNFQINFLDFIFPTWK